MTFRGVKALNDTLEGVRQPAQAEFFHTILGAKVE